MRACTDGQWISRGCKDVNNAWLGGIQTTSKSVVHWQSSTEGRRVTRAGNEPDSPAHSQSKNYNQVCKTRPDPFPVKNLRSSPSINMKPTN